MGYFGLLVNGKIEEFVGSASQVDAKILEYEEQGESAILSFDADSASEFEAKLKKEKIRTSPFTY